MTNDELLDRVEELEELLNEALSDKEWEEREECSLADDVSDLEDEIQVLVTIGEELQERLPVGAHEI